MLHNHNISNALHQVFSVVALTLALVFPATVHSALTVATVDLTRSATPLSEQIFMGTITNTTGADLLASEVFVNFSGFDAAVFEPIPLLGANDFTIANNTTSALTALFSVTLKAAAVVGQTYSMDVFFQGPGVNDISDAVVTMQVIPDAIPEPSATLLMFAGLLFVAVAVGARRRA